MDLFSYESAETLYQTLFKLYKKDEARRCISLIKLLYNYGTRLNLFTKKNPFSCLRIKTAKPTKLYIPKEDVDALIAKAQEMNLPQVKLAIELNYYFSQRPADILKLRKEHIYQKYGYHFFEIQQNKTKTKTKALIPPFLLEEVLKKDDFIITNKHNKPYKVDSFSRIFKKVNDACGFNYTFRLFSPYRKYGLCGSRNRFKQYYLAHQPFR